MKPCGAKTRSGEPCKRSGSGAGGRCKLHGGKSRNGPDCNLWKHGAYSKYLRPDEGPDFEAFKQASGLHQDGVSELEELQLFRLVTALAGPGYIAEEKRAGMLDTIMGIRLKAQKLRGGEKPDEVNVNINAREDLVGRIAGLAARRRTAGGTIEPE